MLQLSKEDEDAVGDEVEVRREDQDKINTFSRLHQRELNLQEELKNKVASGDARGVVESVLADAAQKEKEEYDDVSSELELADEDDTVPFV